MVVFYRKKYLTIILQLLKSVLYLKYLKTNRGDKMITKRAITPLGIQIKETLQKCRYKRFSLYKNDTGHFKLTYREQMLKDLIFLKFHLAYLRKLQLRDRASNKLFKIGRIIFAGRNKKYCNVSIIDIWNAELKVRKRQKIKGVSKNV